MIDAEVTKLINLKIKNIFDMLVGVSETTETKSKEQSDNIAVANSALLEVADTLATQNEAILDIADAIGKMNDAED